MTDLVKAAGSLVQGSAAQAAGNYNKAVADANATQTERDGAMRAERIRLGARSQMGEQIAAQGASGFAIGTGSALDALKESQINAALDVLTTRRDATAKARSYTYQGNLAKAQGDNAMTAALFDAGSHAIDWANSAAKAGAGG